MKFQGQIHGSIIQEVSHYYNRVAELCVPYHAHLLGR